MDTTTRKDRRVYIRGMIMPATCGECLMYNNGDCCICCHPPLKFNQPRPFWCPLREEIKKRGKWTGIFICSNYSGYDYAMTCSVCGKHTYKQLAEPMPPYCPNCGAKMDNEEEKNATD